MGCAVSRYSLGGDAFLFQRAVEESESGRGGEGNHSSTKPLSQLDLPTPNKKDNDQGDEEEDDDLDERRISNFDDSNLVGSPSFREYCQPIESCSDEEEDEGDDVKNNLTEKEEKPTNEITTPQEEVSEPRTRIASGIRRLRRATTAIATISNVRNIFHLSRQTSSRS